MRFSWWLILPSRLIRSNHMAKLKLIAQKKDEKKTDLYHTPQGLVNTLMAPSQMTISTGGQ